MSRSLIFAVIEMEEEDVRSRKLHLWISCVSRDVDALAAPTLLRVVPVRLPCRARSFTVAFLVP